MFLAIPTFSDVLFYTQITTLSGSAYTLSFSFNSRETCWYMSVGDAGGAPLATGLKITVNAGLLGPRGNPLLPPGEIFAFTESGDLSPPGVDELGPGLRCTLIYSDTPRVIP